MNEFETEMNMIIVAGESKGISFAAMEAAEEGDFVKAQELLTGARRKLGEAHQVHNDLLAKFSSGEKVETNLLLVHAMDHLTSAEMILQMAEKLCKLYERIEK